MLCGSLVLLFIIIQIAQVIVRHGGVAKLFYCRFQNPDFLHPVRETVIGIFPFPFQEILFASLTVSQLPVHIPLIIPAHGAFCRTRFQNRQRVLVKSRLAVIQRQLQIIVGFVPHFLCPCAPEATLRLTRRLFIKTSHIKRVDFQTFLQKSRRVHGKLSHNRCL